MTALDSDIDALAASLHGGWLAYMTALGYRWGPRRDPQTRRHPDLRPFADLAQASKDRERVIAAALVEWVNAHGFRLVSSGVDDKHDHADTPFPESADNPEDPACRAALTLEHTRNALQEPLTITVFREWARSRADFADLPEDLTVPDWHRLTTEDKRAQDRAAVGGFLQCLHDLGYQVYERGAT